MPLFPVDEPLWWLPALRVYLGVLLMGAAAWPWWRRLWKEREDQGAGMWPAGGVFLYVLLMQLIWRTGLLELRFVWSLFLMAGVGLSGRWLLPKTSFSEQTRNRIRGGFKEALLVFSILFWIWALIRSADPGANHTEQPMDVMWMRSAMASEAPPIRDSWFGGEAATYYAVGHQMLGFLGIKFGLDAPQAVNVIQVLWFALTGLLAYQAGSCLLVESDSKTRRRAGWICVTAICFVSTVPGFSDALTQDTFWWWWRASRVIQDPAGDLITEFPFFSFYLGDNHAHLLGVPILILSVLSAVQLCKNQTLTLLNLLPSAVCVGWSWTVNPWQTPTSLAFLVSALILRGRIPTASEWRSLALLVWPLLLLVLPQRAAGPELSLEKNTGGQTGFSEALLVFGYLLPGVVWAMFRKGASFRWIVLLMALGMWAVCEVVFLQDIFQNRMNTVFKVYYQIWILLGIIGAAGWATAIQKGDRLRGLAFVSLLASFLPGVWYAGRLIQDNVRAENRSLHAWSAESRDIQILLALADRHVNPGDLILEAPGQSYRADTSQLGTWTAGDTILGWTGHQNQWRPGRTHPDPMRFYRASSKQEFDQLLKEIRPAWVLWGPQEREMVTPHTDWISWMDGAADRLIQEPRRTLFRIR